jgi:hypothetical protein
MKKWTWIMGERIAPRRPVWLHRRICPMCRGWREVERLIERTSRVRSGTAP